MYSFLLFLFSIGISCSKDEVKKVKENTQSVSSSSALVFDIKDSKGNNTKSERGKTILGIKRNNPFTITNMATAHNILYSTSISEMPTTDLYVKFTPNSIEELKALYATDGIFYDYPLEYEVLEMGDYYQELSADEFPILYTVVKPDFELAHASHYTVVDDVFWMNVIAAELKADNIDGHPHGNPSSWEADRIALCESWAEHIGRSFAHLTYGVNNNVSTNDVSVLTYMNWLEKQRNETADHIPIGYYHDLIDNVNQIETAKDGDMLYGSAYSINDEISGLTNHQLFSLLDANVTSPVILTTKIKNSNYLTGQNTNQKLDNLFNSY